MTAIQLGMNARPSVPVLSVRMAKFLGLPLDMFVCLRGDSLCSCANYIESIVKNDKSLRSKTTMKDCPTL